MSMRGIKGVHGGFAVRSEDDEPPVRYSNGHSISSMAIDTELTLPTEPRSAARACAGARVCAC